MINCYCFHRPITATVDLSQEPTVAPIESVVMPVPVPESATPVKEETKPIATTPKLRGKRNFNPPECQKPHEEYSAEADDEMEEEIKKCNKKQLMVALKDINADKKLVEGSSVKMYSLDQRKPESASSSAHVSPQKAAELNESPAKASVEKASPSTESVSDRHSVAVPKKTKKQKIIANEEENVEPDVYDQRKPDELKGLKDRLDEAHQSIDTAEKNKSFEAETKSNNVSMEAKVDSPEKEEDVGSSNELGSDDMEICDDTTTTTNAYEPRKYSPSKSEYPTASELSQRENHSVEPEPKSAEPKTPEAEMRAHPFSNSSPTNSHDKWPKDAIHAEQPLPEAKSVVSKVRDSSEGPAPTKTTSHVSPTKLHENAVKAAEVRPNVIVDAQNETQEVQPQISPLKIDATVEMNEAKEKQISPKKLASPPANPKPSPITRSPTEPIANKVTDSETSPNKVIHSAEQPTPAEHIVKTVAPVNRIEHVSPREKAKHQTPEVSPEKARDSKNSVIKSVNEPIASTNEVMPLSGSAIDVSKNDETKTTTQDFCQRIDPNKTPQCGKAEAKLETKHEPFKMDYGSPPLTSPSAEKGHRVPENVKTSPKEAIIQPKEEPNRMEGNLPVPANQPAESNKNRYKQQQSHSSKPSYSSKSQNNEHKKATSASQSQYDIKRESKETKSNSGNEMRRESPTKASKQAAAYASSSSKNFSNDLVAMGGKSSMSSGSMPGSEKKYGSAEKKSTSSDKKSNSAEKKAPEMRGNIDADLNKMRPQFAMNQLPNYHTAHQYYNLTPWDAYNYHSGYNLPHLDPAATQKSPTKFHKDLANSMYGGMTTNYLAANSLAAQQPTQQQVC